MSAEKTSLLALAEGLVSYGQKSGASQVEVTVSEGTEFSVRVREGGIEKLTEAGSRGLSLRLFVDQKAATASSSDLSKETLERLVDNAIKRARLSGSDPFAGLPELEKVSVQAEALKLFDPAIPALPPEKKIAYAKETERIALADKRVKKSTGAGFGSYVETLHLANSSGFSGSYFRTSCSCSVGLQAGEGDNLFQEGWWDQSLRIGDLMPAEAIAKKAVHRVTRLIGARKVESQNVPVVFEPPMTGALLGFLAVCVGGEAVNQGQSFLVGKLGEKIGNDLVTVWDDGLLPGGSGTSPFDTEGVPCRKTAVVERGVLRSYILDTYNARKLKMKSTGNAGGTSNFYLAAGQSAPEEIVKSVEKGLLLTGTMGQGIVPTTGDISRGAFGLWIEKGEIAFPVAEITISGNLGQILKGVAMVGNDLMFRRATTGPTIKVAEMTVGGK
jgi:PmbA protein